ncbi:hypothetical protein LN040_01065 [Desulfovibrio subterraneus]|jgi:chromosome segregation and condensation protein ScpB|uniref:Amphi-Trp domain-containing protein n=1 Tax=Desulfovibrio subterraneus TaxID=2718620 RepID=A0A7J0BJ41_9BACT|nr:hypothetical protein [Desulfovibrio subterraneus]WBF67730.1 hypothetical protein LN040_01065 [Desulfovibrio subterraneus]GFM33568.1 hypothetical protein DSM101010T_19330 [Desulfovibrio subterraneus]
MTKTGKRKVELPITAADVPAMLRQLAEQAEQGKLALGGKEIEVDEYDTFSVSFRQTKNGMRLRVKVKYGKSGQDDDSDD